MVVTAFALSDVDVMFANDTTAILTYRVKQTVDARGGGQSTKQDMSDTSTWVHSHTRWQCVLHTESPMQAQPAEKINWSQGQTQKAHSPLYSAILPDVSTLDIRSSIAQPAQREQTMSSNVASVEMLIRKSPKDVFGAFAEPRTIEKFWLKSASGPLAKDAIVEWEFMVQGAHETVTVTEFLANQTIAFTWSDGIAVKMMFNPQDGSSTRVLVTATGFKGKDATLQSLNATEGFAIILCDLKSLLETGQSGNMVRDKAALIIADKADA